MDDDEIENEQEALALGVAVFTCWAIRDRRLIRSAVEVLERSFSLRQKV